MSTLLDTDRVGHILTVGPLAYLAVIVLIRTFGKRTLSKMNAFDLVVTFAMGSLLATVVIDDQISLVEGMTAFGVLLSGQFLITFLSTRSDIVIRLVKASPALVYSRGSFLDEVLKRERVNRVEVVAAARNAGYGTLDEVDAVILETDGSFSVLTGVSEPTELPHMEGKTAR